MPSNDHSLIAKPFTKPTPSRTVALAWRVSFTRPQVIDLLTQALER
jgi:LysR family hydrogen peroxide-inducible transcriptional activator